jgi:hypothetical protein
VFEDPPPPRRSPWVEFALYVLVVAAWWLAILAAAVWLESCGVP